MVGMGFMGSSGWLELMGYTEDRLIGMSNVCVHRFLGLMLDLPA